MIEIFYLVGSESSAFAILGLGPVDSRTITTDTGDVHLQLAGDALLEIDDRLGLIRTDFNSSDLYNSSVLVIEFVALIKQSSWLTDPLL